MRIGMGYDVHILTENRRLVLGGVEIPYVKGLLGNSDADVLVHSIMDAMLGSLALGDIGRYFPDTNKEFTGINSCILLKNVHTLIKQYGYDICNIDCVLVAQAPKLAPYIDRMRHKLAEVMTVDVGKISIKATTTEGLGFEGRGEGISAHAVVLVEKT